MQILLVTTWFPYPADNGSRLRQYHLLKGLASRHRVHLLALCTPPVAPPYPEALQSLCASIETIQARVYDSHSPRASLAFAAPTPRAFVDTYSPEMERALKRRLQEPFDLVLLCESGLLPYSHLLRDRCAIWDEIEFGYLYPRGHRRHFVHDLRSALTRWKMFHYMRRRAHYFAAGTVVSENEQRLAAAVLGSRLAIRLVPNCVDARQYAPPAAPADNRRLVFAGSLQYPVNLDAMRFFLRDIYPLIQQAVPDVSLHITGQPGSASWPPFPLDDSVHLTGYLPDIGGFISHCALSIVPLRSGGGTRLKILEAMAIGTPIVSTSKGAEGLAVEHGKHLLLADEPQAFAAAVIRLLHDMPLRTTLAANARALVAAQYDWSVMLPGYLDWLDAIATTRNNLEATRLC